MQSIKYNNSSFTIRLIDENGVPVFVRPEDISVFMPESYEDGQGNTQKGTLVHMKNGLNFIVTSPAEEIAGALGKVAVLA